MDASISVVVVGQDSLVVDVEGFFFVARHEVDVELGYADLAEAVELLAMLLDGAYHAEAVDYFVGYDFGVFAAVLYERGQRGRKFFRFVLRDEVHHVIGNEGGKPADMFAGSFHIVGGPDGGGGHDFDLAEVAAGFFGAFADEAEAPVDQVGVGKLENDAIADASGGSQGFGAVASDPDARDFAIGPGKFRGDAVEVDRFAGVQVAEDAYKFLEVFERGGLLAKNAAGTVAAADA